MDLLTLLFRLPFLPLRGFIRLGEIIQDEAERQLHDPAAVRRQLEEAEQARMSGELSDEEVAQAEGEAAERVLATPQKPSAGTSESSEGS
jgi:cytochrome c-type biogenesis protein CcmH/NrfG